MRTPATNNRLALLRAGMTRIQGGHSERRASLLAALRTLTDDDLGSIARRPSLRQGLGLQRQKLLSSDVTML
jgi:hypothetical protein